MLHPELLPALLPRDGDIDEQPLQQLAAKPLLHHVARLALALAFYAPLVLVVLYAPVKLGHRLLPPWPRARALSSMLSAPRVTRTSDASTSTTTVRLGMPSTASRHAYGSVSDHEEARGLPGQREAR